MRKYKIIQEVSGGENRVVEGNIEECELESYIRKYIRLDYLVQWYEYKYDVDLKYDNLTMIDLDNFTRELRDSLVGARHNTMVYLSANLFITSYEQNVRLFVSLFDYGKPEPVCAKPDGEHKLIILDNGVVHSDTTDKPVGTINYDVSVDDFDFNSFKFCGEVVIDTAKYLNCLASGTSLADMVLKFFNGKTPFDIEFAEKEKQ